MNNNLSHFHPRFISSSYTRPVGFHAAFIFRSFSSALPDNAGRMAFACAHDGRGASGPGRRAQSRAGERRVAAHRGIQRPPTRPSLDIRLHQSPLE